MLGFYVTDHSADGGLQSSSELILQELYRDIRRDGINLIRYDFRWSLIEPKKNQFDEGQIRRYARASTLMRKEGLDSPIVILSSIPGWALEEYKNDKKGFFKSFRIYTVKVWKSLMEVNCKLTHIQVLNEWNNPIYTPIEINDLPQLCEIVREIFDDHPGIKVMGTIIASNFNNFLARVGFGMNLFEYLRKLREIRSSFDVIAVDYYPGLWHLPLSETGLNWKKIFMNLEMLEKVFREIAGWGIEYELGETGLPTKWPWSEQRQLQFYQTFLKSFLKLIIDFERRGITPPSRVGLYQAIDEPPKNLFGKILRVLTPFPQHDMGMRRSNGICKLILQEGISGVGSNLRGLIESMQKMSI